ncbi:hypothetical protein ACFX14_004873 [Malus domestica]
MRLRFLVNDAEKDRDIDPQEIQQTLEMAETNLRKAKGKRQIIKANLALRQARIRVKATNVMSQSVTNNSAKKSMLLSSAAAAAWEDPATALANARHEFGEHGGVNMSIEASATFTVMEPETLRKMFFDELGADRDFFIYSCHFNPTVLNLSPQMAVLEGIEAAYCTSSGMSTISFVLLQLDSSGEHIVASKTVYGGTHAVMSHFFPRAYNITTTFVDINDMNIMRNTIEVEKTKVLYFEGMSNPTLTVANISELSRIGHEKGVTVVVDNTFSLMVLSPVKLGADVIVDSISKFISSGADIITGVMCRPTSLVNLMMDLHQGSLMLLGPIMNAKVAFELFERIPHLGLRMKEHYHRAMVYAQRMKKMGENKYETLYFDMNTGAKIPYVGLRTWKTKPSVVGQAVIAEVKNGYTHIDCASVQHGVTAMMLGSAVVLFPT